MDKELAEKVTTKVIPSMQHWNGDQLCAIDCETSGLDSNFHEIMQIAILPLDYQLMPRSDVMPFCINLRPDHPERVDSEAVKVSRLKLAEMAATGYDQEKAKDLLLDWVDKLKLPLTPSGKRKRIIPLGHWYSFDRGFISKWLGQSQYSDIFSNFEQDTSSIAGFLNNNSAMNHGPILFPKLSLQYLCNLLNVEHYRAHDALEDCLATSRCYKKLVMRGVWS